jgi:hypothetical protein
MDKQEIFDQVVAHARRQGKKSELPPPASMVNPRSRYFGPDGLKCFLGIFIQPNEYHREWETMDIMMVLNDYRCPQSLTIRLAPVSNTPQFLEDLQNIHDRQEVEDWERSFQSVAKAYNLKYTAP